MSATPARAALFVVALFVSLGLAACGPPGGAEPLEERVLGQWGDDDGASPWLRIAEDGTLSGSDGCNRMSGSWAVADDRVTTSEVLRTQMWCESYTEWIGHLASMEIDGEELIIFDADGERIGSLKRA